MRKIRRARSADAERKARQRADPANRAHYNTYQRDLMRRRRAALRTIRSASALRSPDTPESGVDSAL
jgi:hypothetical protein